MTNELRLFAACARVSMTDRDRADSARAIDAGIDWPRWQTRAHAHGIAALCHLHSRSGAVALPLAVREALAAAATSQARRNLDLTARLLQLLEWFDHAGIVVLPLKGPLLAERVYGSVALRRTLDLDIAVHPRDMAATINLLKRNGYAVCPRFPDGFDPLEARLSHDIELASGAGDPRVELHRTLISAVHGSTLSFEWAARELRASTFRSQPILELSDEALLVYLCAHGAAHGWERLEWLTAVRELIVSGRVRNWTHVVTLAHAAGALRRVNAALALASRVLGGGSPSPLMTGGGDPDLDRSVDLAVRNLDRGPGAPGAFGRSLAYGLRTDDTLRACAGRCASVLFQPWPEDVRAIPLPPRCWRAYYALHPLLALGRMAARAWR